MKIVDCFTFFNELDLLEFRLKLLDGYVDHFVIAESNLTHSGKDKAFIFEENKKRFEPWLHKIIYLPITQTVEGLDLDKKETGYNPESAAWKLENEQRNALSYAARIVANDDLVIIGDLDEMPSPLLLKKLNVDKAPVVLSMLFHYYFLNCQNNGSERWWNGSIVCTGKQFQTVTPQQLRDNRNVYKRIQKGGWHFSYLGGLEKIKYKIRSFAHTEFNRGEYLKDEHIIAAMEKGIDIFNRPGTIFKFVPVDYYPAKLRRIMLQYPAFIHVKRKAGLFEKAGYSIKNIFVKA